MFKRILLSIFLLNTLLFSFTCNKSDISKLFNFGDNFKIIKIKNSKEILNYCEVYILNQSSRQDEYEVVYANPKKKILLTGVTIFKKNNGKFLSYTGQLLNEFHKILFDNKKNEILKYFKSNPKDLKKLITNSIKKDKKSKYSILEFVNTRCGYCKKQDEYLKNKKLSINKLYVPTIASAEEMIKEVDGLKIDYINQAVKTWNNLNLSVTPTNIIIDTKTNEVIDVVFGANEEKLSKYF